MHSHAKNVCTKNILKNIQKIQEAYESVQAKVMV